MQNLFKQVPPPVSDSPDTSRFPPEKIESSLRTRRNFLGRAINVLATLVGLTLLPLRAHSSTHEGAPDAVTQSLADLGKLLLDTKPQQAHELGLRARKAVGLDLQENIDWKMAAIAQEQLTASDRVSAELARAEVVHIGGWLITHSEAGAALLYAAAASAGESPLTKQPQK